MAIDGARGSFTVLPRSLTRRPDAQQIVNALFKDKQNVLLKMQKKTDRSEYYTLIQPLPSFANTDFGVLINKFTNYTEPANHFMKEYTFFGIIPASAFRNKNYQGFKSNGYTIQFKNCDSNPNSLFAFLPSQNLQTPRSNGHSSQHYENQGVAVDWRSKAIPITNPDRMMPNKFFFLTELHFGGCGVQSKIVTKQLKTCINKFYGCIDLRVIFQSAHRIKSFFPYKDRFNRSQVSKVVCKASCWDCQESYIGKTKRRLHDRKTEHFKGITSTCHASAIGDHVTATGHNIKWDHFEILAKGRSDTHSKIKETLLSLLSTLNDNVSSEKLYLY